MAEIRMDISMQQNDTHEKNEHAAKEYTVLQVASNLAVVCIVSGLIIALTYFITAPVAAQKSELLTQQAMQRLVTSADSFEAVDNKEEWFAAKQGNEVVAYIVPSSIKGYGGEISMLVAVSTGGTVIDYQILTANETPGLGDNASKKPFRSQFEGKFSEQLLVTKDKANTTNIQAMTGATITSKAVTTAVKEAQDEVNAFVGGA